jgi:glucuronoarabinoxylan endo-1,4-beta-xylanase
MRWCKVLGVFLVLAVNQRALAQTAATVTWTTTYQTIDGFGASNHSVGTAVNPYDMFFFSTLGYSILRTGVTEDGSCTSVSYECANDGFAINGRGTLADMQSCVANGCQVYAVPWTPPAIYKTNSNYSCSAGAGNGSLATSDYASYATYLSNYIASLSVQGVPLWALSVQNEPNQCNIYASALWSDANFDSFIKNNLVPTLAANGQSGVVIAMPESAHYSDLTSAADTCLADSSCANSVSAVTFHDYDEPSSLTNPYSSKRYWQTEMWDGAGAPNNNSGCSSWCPGIGDAMFWANTIDNAIVNGNANAWLYWWLVTNGPDNNGLLLSTNGQVAIRAYVLAQYSKFVRPGWVRIDATHVPQSGITISAYKNASTGAFAVVATNQNSSNTTQAFSLSGFTATSVTPYVTSSSLSLAQQSTVTAGSSFSYGLPAQSVTTFVGAVSESKTEAGLAPPTALNASVH